MYYTNYPSGEDRFFLVPFLLGGLGGAAIVGATRPRPVYVNPPTSQVIMPQTPQYGYNYYGGYNYNMPSYYPR